MQRICRALRVGARVFKDNEVPVVAGEEVRRNQEEKFNPQRRINECFGLSTGLIVSWDLYHRYRSRWTCPEVPDESSSKSKSKPECPFSFKKSFAAVAAAQPIFSSSATTTVRHVIPQRANQTTVVKKGSIDASPFLKESLFASDCESQGSVSFSTDDEDSFAFKEELPAKTVYSKPKDPKVAAFAERVAANLLSTVGVTHLLLGDNGSKPEPPMSGLELLKNGAELGSARALYNLGVYYDRQRDYELARDYYKRAADIGHPIASYNYAAMILEKDQNLTAEVKLLMSYAYEHGVPEARPYALQ